MTRVTHRLAPNDEQNVPTYRIYLHVIPEITRAPDGSEVHRFGAAWACYERKRGPYRGAGPNHQWHRFGALEDLWTWLDLHSYRGSLTYVYASDFDYLAGLIALDSEARRAGWTCTKWAQQKHFLFARFQGDRGAIMLVDFRNYWPGDVAKLARELGAAAPLDADPEREHVPNELEAIRAVETMRQFMNSLYGVASEEHWGRFKPTLPGIAWSAWRHSFMDKRPLVIADPKLSDFERSAYHGGRVEVFRVGRIEGEVYQLDVNSMYPHVMARHAYPLHKLAASARLTAKGLDGYAYTHDVIARVLLDTPEPAYPLTQAGKLIFPIGQFETTLPTAELRYALKHNHVARVFRSVIYRSDPMFAAFVEWFYVARRTATARGEHALALAYKLILNSLYGKLGQRSAYWDRCKEPFPNPPASFLYDCKGAGTPLEHRSRYGDVWHLERGGESNDSLPGVAACITSWARRELWEMITRAGREHVYYCDTDSLFVDSQGYARLVNRLDNTRLGALKLVGQYEWATFYGPKDYETSSGRVAKGIRADAEPLPDGAYRQAERTSYSQMLARGRDGEIRVRSAVKRLERAYGKGIVGEDGWVRPYVLDLA